MVKEKMEVRRFDVVSNKERRRKMHPGC